MSLANTRPPCQQDPLQAAALELLTIHADYMAREKRTRRHLILAAQRTGLTNAAIGAALNMTEAGVRMFLNRAEVAA